MKRILREERLGLVQKDWQWCGYHKSHPMVSWDPCGDPYCWVGIWYGEVDLCGSVPSLTVRIVEVDP